MLALVLVALVLRRDRGSTRALRIGVFFERDRFDDDEPPDET